MKRFLLSGGGVKCLYQIIFLQKVLKLTSAFQIHGVSFGAIIGFYICIGQGEKLLNYMKTYQFTPSLPLLSYIKPLTKYKYIGKYIDYVYDFIWVTYSIYHGSFYSFNTTMLDETFDNLTTKDKQYLENYHCYVYNLTDNKPEVIKGTDIHIKDFLIAACSCWGMYNPVVINNKKYIDYGIISNIPLLKEYSVQNNKNDIDNEENKCIDVILTTDDIESLSSGRENIKIEENVNLISYLLALVSFSIDSKVKHHFPIDKLQNYQVINYIPPTDRPNDLNPDIIKQIIDDGSILGDKYNCKMLFDFDKNFIIKNNNK
jgi:predicted patatin/cPLA2 family phospholipase